MKKFLTLLFVLTVAFSMNAFADCCHDKIKSSLPKMQTCFENDECKFLCFCVTKKDLYQALCLSETQICKANKIQENYEFETLSMRERIQCEEERLNNMYKACACDKDIKTQKRMIKNMYKDLKKTCKCFKEEFIGILSDSQIRIFKKYAKINCDKCDE